MITEFGVADRVRGEVSATGLWFSAHPLDVLVDSAALRGTVPAAEIERHAGRRVAVTGLPCASRRVETKDGGVMLFLTLADQSGLVECVLFPPAYRAFARVVRAEAVRIEGRVEAALDAISVTVERAFACGAEDYGVARQSGDRRVSA
jgi:DNA polymerase III alpha subunit